MGDSELNTTERIGKVVYRLARGQRMTTADVASLAEISHSGAWYMLTKLSRVIPIVQTTEYWYLDFFDIDGE